MALLLFVRSIDDVMPAVEAASEFLAYKQQHLEGSRQSDDLLAIMDRPRSRGGASGMVCFSARHLK